MTDKTKLAAARDEFPATGNDLKSQREIYIWFQIHENTLRELLDQAIGEETDAPKCQHENRSTGYDHIDCRDCGAFKTDGQWGVASRKWFKNKAEAEFYKEHGRYPEAHPPAVDWIEGAQNDIESAKEFIGGIIAVRGYGDEPYAALLRTLKTLDAVKEGMKKS